MTSGRPARWRSSSLPLPPQTESLERTASPDLSTRTASRLVTSKAAVALGGKSAPARNGTCSLVAIQRRLQVNSFNALSTQPAYCWHAAMSMTSCLALTPRSSSQRTGICSFAYSGMEIVYLSIGQSLGIDDCIALLRDPLSEWALNVTRYVSRPSGPLTTHRSSHSSCVTRG